MAKKKEVVRDYKFSDGVLKQKADDVVGSVYAATHSLDRKYYNLR